MKVIIAGSRTITCPGIVSTAIAESGFEVTEVVSGTARGVDRVGEQIADDFGIPVRRFPADWTTYGKIAGLMRNKEMAKYAQALIAIWDGVSKGTAHMITEATKAGLKVFIYKVDTEAHAEASQSKEDKPTSRPRIRFNRSGRGRRFSASSQLD